MENRVLAGRTEDDRGRKAQHNHRCKQEFFMAIGSSTCNKSDTLFINPSVMEGNKVCLDDGKSRYHYRKLRGCSHYNQQHSDRANIIAEREGLALQRNQRHLQIHTKNREIANALMEGPQIDGRAVIAGKCVSNLLPNFHYVSLNLFF